MLRIAGIIKESIVDGPGLRYTIFTQGCPHDCKGCHNPETHDFQGGKDIDIAEIIDDIEKNPLLDGITLSGGEPFCQPEELVRLAEAVKEKRLNIMAYSGWTLEELIEMGKSNESISKLLDLTDYLVDGPFILEQRDLELHFRGSKNQRYIDMSVFRQTGEIKEMD